MIAGAAGIMTIGMFGFFFFKEETEKKSKNNVQIDIMQVAFFSLPPLIINLKSGDQKNHILKANFILEIAQKEDKDKMDHLQPIILDQFQTYLRELEVQDLQGSTGLERIRQELFSRVTTLTKPLGIEVRNVLFKNFLIS